METNKLEITEKGIKLAALSLQPNKQQWLNSVNHFDEVLKEQGKEIFIDDDIVNASKGFMTTPIGLHNGVAIEAGTWYSSDFEHFKKQCLNEASKFDSILYMTFKDEERYYWRGALLPKSAESV